jgi:hypothetical protein
MLAAMLATVALAPSLSVSGTTLQWTPVGKGSYKVNAKVQGVETTNTIVEGTTYAPPAQPGVTVDYRVKARGEVEWSNTVTIAWPVENPKEKPKEKPKEEPPEEEHKPPPSMLTGVNAGTESLDLTGVSTLHAKAVRIPFSAGEANATWLLEWDKRYAERGVTMQPVAAFTGRMLSSSEARGLVALDKLPGLKNVELGNETSFGYQYHDGYSSSSYKERARLYAVRVKEAAEVLNPHGIGVLAQAEDGGSGSSTWVKEMFASVPALSQYVSAWVIHPYSNQHSSTQPDTSGVPKMERMVANLAEQGDATTPIAITEWGVSTDEGLPLNNGTSLSFAEAGKIVETTIPKLITAAKRHPIASFLVYQVRDQREHKVSNDHEMYFGALTHTDGAKGALTTAIEKLMAE